MEVFDVVNEKDEVVGQATRDECHADPKLIHRVVHFTLIDKKSGKVLITQRSFTKKTDPGKICILGEHLVSGETYQEAISRGVKEELGFEPKTVKELAVNLFRYSQQTEIGRFFVIEWNGEEIKFNSDELVNVEWLFPEELVNSKRNYSDITRYWINTINWRSVLTTS